MTCILWGCRSSWIGVLSHRIYVIFLTSKWYMAWYCISFNSLNSFPIPIPIPPSQKIREIQFRFQTQFRFWNRNCTSLILANSTSRQKNTDKTFALVLWLKGLKATSGPHIRGGPIFRTGFSILSAKGFRWVGGSEKPVRKDCRISKTCPLKKREIH